MLALVIATAVACSPVTNHYGYTPPQKDLESLEIGVADKLAVLEVIGQPAVTNTRYGDSWFYLSNSISQSGFWEPQEVDRQVVVVSFDNAGLMSNVEVFALEDGRAVALSRRVTETNLGQLNVIQQFLRGLGRIDPTGAFGEE